MKRVHPTHMPEDSDDLGRDRGIRCNLCGGAVSMPRNGADVTYLGARPCPVPVGTGVVDARRLLDLYMASQRAANKSKAAEALGIAPNILSNITKNQTTPSANVVIRMILSTGLGPAGLLRSGIVIIGGDHTT